MLAVVSSETQEEQPRNGHSRNTPVPRINEDYNTQVSEEAESTVIKKLSHKFSRTKSRILGALSKLDEFLLNPEIRTITGTVPVISRNTEVENQEPTGDRSQSDSHPEMESSVYQSPKSIDSHRRGLSHWNNQGSDKINKRQEHLEVE